MRASKYGCSSCGLPACHRTPTVGIPVVDCASALSGHAADPAIALMKSRRLTGLPQLWTTKFGYVIKVSKAENSDRRNGLNNHFAHRTCSGPCPLWVSFASIGVGREPGRLSLLRRATPLFAFRPEFLARLTVQGLWHWL